MNDLFDIAYSAGFFDGEGSIHIGSGPRYQLQVQLVNTYRPVLEWFQERWGGTIYEHPPDIRVPHASAVWTLAWGSREAKEQVLKGLLPHLIIKRRAAEIALAWLETVLPRMSIRKVPVAMATRHRLREEMRGLKEYRPRRPRTTPYKARSNSVGE